MPSGDLAQFDGEYKHETYEIIGAAIEVQSVLGAGLLERIYVNALAIELGKQRGHAVSTEHECEVFYKGHPAGKQRLDLVVRVNGTLFVVEAKHFPGTDAARWMYGLSQLGSYLTVADCRVGLLLNFGIHPVARSARRVLNPALRPKGT